MTSHGPVFNPPPGWPKPPPGWVPPKGWTPEPSWPKPPPGWELWLHAKPATEGASPPHDEPSASASEPPSSASEPPASEGDDGPRSVGALEAEVKSLRAQVAALSTEGELVQLNDDHILQEIGIYRYHHPLENAVAYKDQLHDLVERIRGLARERRAIEVSDTFTLDNSLAKGQRMTRDLAKLMLRAYNAAVENSLRALRAGNVITAKRRIEVSRNTIARLGQLMKMRISEEFHALRLEELELTSDYLMKKREEREAAREERARLREERKVQLELAAERERLDKERQHFENAIAALKAAGSSDPELELRLAAIDEAIAQNDYRVANIRAGYVYVISNRGALGENVVKIGLTRRLEPQDRVRELSGASVPFRFDVHALFFSEDAVGLEADLHRHFADRRVNRANTRKEFFFATPEEVRDVLISRMGNLLEFTEHAESTEYLQSKGGWPAAYRRGVGD